MRTFITDVSSKYGAPMGRHTGPETLNTDIGLIVLHKVPLNSGGYDSGGAYWGHGQTLWETMDNDGDGFIFRESNRDSAKNYIWSMFPDAKFYR